MGVAGPGPAIAALESRSHDWINPALRRMGQDSAEIAAACRVSAFDLSDPPFFRL